MNYLDTIALIHAKMLDAEAVHQEYLNSIEFVKHPIAETTRAEWTQELEQVRADKQDFLELTASDPIEAIKQFHDYLFPEQLKVKHEIEHL